MKKYVLFFLGMLCMSTVVFGMDVQCFMRQNSPVFRLLQSNSSITHKFVLKHIKNKRVQKKWAESLLDRTQFWQNVFDQMPPEKIAGALQSNDIKMAFPDVLQIEIAKMQLPHMQSRESIGYNTQKALVCMVVHRLDKEEINRMEALLRDWFEKNKASIECKNKPYVVAGCCRNIKAGQVLKPGDLTEEVIAQEMNTSLGDPNARTRGEGFMMVEQVDYSRGYDRGLILLLYSDGTIKFKINDYLKSLIRELTPAQIKFACDMFDGKYEKFQYNTCPYQYTYAQYQELDTILDTLPHEVKKIILANVDGYYAKYYGVKAFIRLDENGQYVLDEKYRPEPLRIKVANSVKWCGKQLEELKRWWRGY